jgi:hypothetical protein
LIKDVSAAPGRRVAWMDARFNRKALLLLIGLAFCSVLVSVYEGQADDHKGSKHQFKKTEAHPLKKDDNGKKGDHGNETTGEFAAWILGLANFPVALSIILKTCAKFIPPGLSLKDSISGFNRQQKKYLMKLHYWLNPAALGIALTHFLLSTCRSTGLPEWGLGIMLATGLLGLMMKFKLSPPSMRQRVFKFHTSPILLITGISILLIGHSIAD